MFKNPLHPYTKGLLKAVPNPMVKSERLEAILGTVSNLITPLGGCRFHSRYPYAKDICRKEEPPLIEVEQDHHVACWLS
ncbi:MAG: hypothetical protein J7J05_07165 [Thermococcus sp.]|nr:oligopeptide/dipeptide ABC transporter ATP-binding protein [Thermococcus sp.]MCD6140683.1 hypothetical protein [Thermococcus sp.]OYT32938.1 MAG: hypothetical protein B6U96_18495 [Archaeoglobales archaeon ex4484_92]RLF76942.1 MAG: hypothetical protein DRN51_01130 [Thermococci archaeon]